MIIHEPEIVLANGEVILQARVETLRSNTKLPERLWFSYPERWAGSVSNRADSILAALILVALTVGEDLECRGELSPRLYYHLNEYQKIFIHWQPEVFHPIQIRAEKICPAPIIQKEVRYAAAFSAGVDSFFTLHQLLNPAPEKPGWPLKYAFFLQGSPDIPLIYTQKYQELVNRYSGFLQELGVELIPVRTNLMHFSANRIGLKTFLESPLAGAALGLSPLLSGIFMPSGRLYQRYTDNTTGPITTHLLSTEGFESFDFGSGYTRFEKTLAISDWAPAQENLRVCFGWTNSGTQNCSNCSKCLRTRMDLNVIGRLQKFSTLKSPFSLKDTLLWGRWLETGYGWEQDVLNYTRKHRKNLVPGVLLGILMGSTRHGLRKILPEWLKKQIFKLTAEHNPHEIFANISENGERSAK
jgi:hypothetical protein